MLEKFKMFVDVPDVSQPMNTTTSLGAEPGFPGKAGSGNRFNDRGEGAYHMADVRQ